MKTYFKSIQITQTILMDVSVLILLILPIIFSFFPDVFLSHTTENLYLISHASLFFVMIIRPLADIVKNPKWIRPLVILRKGAGILSASIIVSFIVSKIIISPTEYFSSFLTIKYWSLEKFALLAHLGDISAIVLLITSNNLSKRILRSWWKKIQKLSYVYFYTSASYVFFSYGDTKMLWAMIMVTILTMLAYKINENKRIVALQIKTI